MENIKILLLMPEIFWGGAERQFRFLIENANAHNADIVLLNMHLHNSEETSEGIQFIKNSDVAYYEIAPKSKVNTTLGRISYSRELNKAIGRILNAQKIDAAIVYEPQGCYSIPYLKRRHIKTIYSERNSGEGVVNARLLKTLVKKANVIACNSSAAKTVLENGLKRKVTLINNGIQTDTQKSVKIKETPAQITILVPARIAPVKNQLLVVEMLHLMNERSNLKVIFAGKTEDAAYEALLKEKISEYELEGIFEFAGFVSDMDSLYSRADIVILPSLVEGMSNVVLECFAKRKMLICSRIPMNCVNSEVEKFAFNPNDPSELCNMVRRVIELSTEEKERYIQANFDYVCREYSIDKMVEGYIRLAK